MAVSKITSGIEKTTATAGSGVTLSVNNIMKKDNILRVKLGGTVTLSAGTYATVASIPSEYAPKTNVMKMVMLTPATAGFFRIYTNGEIQFRTLSGATLEFYIDETLLML